ncbi:hypothetical protein GCM10023231_18480 [Olivibacter ginsenosidimutans]|uniref:Crp/Fnr family transcriptional regulator n=1 Tax=Olivibacter ginsenosidimutans TaxID=1176537 RepID=A0ABP9B972_9SPHI
MNRFFTYAAQYCPLTKEEKQFINAHARTRTYNRHDYYLLAGEAKNNWCFVLDGAAAGVKTNDEGEESLQWLSVKHQYFTGTKHPFSERSHGLQVQFLHPTALMELPYTYLREAQHQYPAFAELLQVLKEQKLRYFQSLTKILKLPARERLHKALDELHNWITPLQVDEVCSLLNISHPMYYNGLHKYLKQW